MEVQDTILLLFHLIGRTCL